MTNCSPSSKRSDYAEPPHGRTQASQPRNSAMRHNPAYGIMGGLMAENGDVRFRIPEALQWRHLDVVARGSEEGFGAAMADHCAGVLEEAVGMFDP